MQNLNAIKIMICIEPIQNTFTLRSGKIAYVGTKTFNKTVFNCKMHRCTIYLPFQTVLCGTF